ncbi:rod shape-determining protein RodA [Solemya velum gill symbiont]|uniref:Peptidoglycan glycosyltransferase MrdB n=3 Tax=Solemya velum gill symbiont TaxID=2340 RepID=A0A0B0H5E3_SOVGS|nr:rod shape-determining protein RodA [Solemya velum gill symbiont]KHF25408.1 cell elongation-specific peptidoglycan biosynthesis regulator RodA [Solemya velum gill symbiont]OOY34331.1 rod shape-determining protein RodA [Solemya velum gill symbiont]OOY36981.1 rod shape-determining protein RodA [Solemya velum gill symbiont]OOY39840.1 rod shape-determining protein RodA [Solemya velum gill symbiont]OOY43402.1 rod shape-determining protein RodA [Solemya velum gill symbiont]
MEEYGYSPPPQKRSGKALLHLDLPLLTGLLLLCAFGLLMLYSASDSDMGLLKRQLLHLGFAFGILFIAAQITPSVLRFVSPWLYIGALLLLIGVLVMGEIGKGAQRWLDLGFIRFQPSEIAKLAVPMMVCWFLATRKLPIRPLTTIAALVLVLLPAALIVRQPDLGTALLVGAAGLLVIYFAGFSWKLIILLVVVLGVAVLAVVNNPDLLDLVLHEYQKKRVLTLFNPENDPLGAGYHIIQSKIAIGSGGIYGKGWLNGTQSHLEFLPEQHTDFIFAVISEELGLIGVITMLLLYMFIILRGLYIASVAQTPFRRLLAGALTLTFFIYLLVNTGMVSGILPVVGVPLPLISYGGTSLVTIMAGFGMIMSVHSHSAARY